MRWQSIALVVLGLVSVSRPASADFCATVVETISAKAEAKVADQKHPQYWITLLHPSVTRIDVTCYGELSQPFAEVTLDDAEPTEGYFATLGRVGEALTGVAASDIAAVARSCVDRARGRPNGQESLKDAAVSYTCAVVAAGSETKLSTVISIARLEKPPTVVMMPAARHRSNVKQSSRRAVDARHVARLAEQSNCQWLFDRSDRDVDDNERR